MTTRLADRIRLWGAAQLFLVVCFIPLSYGIAPLFPPGEPMAREREAFARLAESLAWLPGFLARAIRWWVSGEALASHPRLVAVAVAPLLLAGAICLLGVLRDLARARRAEREGVERLVANRALWFAGASMLAYPVFTQDMWLSIAWGRMAIEGLNPYYEVVTEASLQGLPLEPHVTRMTYGPLWTVASAALSWLARGSPLAEFILAKVLLAALWGLSLWLVARIARQVDASPALAMALFGWMPLSFATTVGEGHNDIGLLAPLLAWGCLACRGRHLAAPYALMASVLVKYVTIILLPLEIWRACRAGQARRPGYWAALAGALLSGAAVVGLFARDLHFLDETLNMRHWSFLRPGGAVHHAAEWLGLPLSEPMAGTLVLVLCATLVCRAAFAFHRDARPTALLDLAIAMLATLLFTATGHVWPWFLIWTIGFAALRVERPLPRYMLALALFAPFVKLFHLRGVGWQGIEHVTLALYALAIPQMIAFGMLLGPMRTGPSRPPGG